MTRNFIGPLLLLSVYLFSLSVILPGGINQGFARTLLFVTFFFLVIATLSYLILARLGSVPPVGENSTSEDFERSDALLLLLPLGPVAHYILFNQDILLWHDNLIIIFIFTLASAITVLVVPRLLRGWASYSVTVMIGLSLTFTMIHMASFSRYFTWHKAGYFPIQLSIFLLVFIVGLVLYRKDRQALKIAIVCYFVGTTAVSYITNSTQRSTSTESGTNHVSDLAEVEQLVEGRKFQHKPDIFLLTYDSYVENETMLQYGIDNSGQETFLESAGFEIYRGVYTIARTSIPSMGGVLGNNDPKQAVAGNSPILNVLQRAGYRTHGVFTSGYFFQGVDSGYDYGFPPPSASFLVITRAIAEGRFRHNVQFQHTSFDQFIDQKRSIMSAQTKQPLFLYTHTGPGHSQNSGSCLPDEVAQFETRLSNANLEMREDVNIILQKNPDAIIIVNGDHGPHLTKNCLGSMAEDYSLNEITPLDIQDRFGSFLAIRWPEKTPTVDGDIVILQDIFPAVLSYLYSDPAFEVLRVPRKLVRDREGGIRGVSVESGYIVGGAYDGKPLYDSASRPDG